MTTSFAAETPSQDGRIPVSVLTGFLGAGKTTLLNHLTRHSDMAGVVVLINEFGEVGIDHHLVEKVDESILLLDSGCLCCSMQGDFVNALKTLHERLARREITEIRRVVVETTGLADPVPVLYTLMEQRYVAARYVCDGVLTVVDGSRSPENLAKQVEAVRQVVMADRILVSKADISSRETLEKVETWVRDLNPTAPVFRTSQGGIAPRHLFAGGVYSPSERPDEVTGWLHNLSVQEHGHHGHHHAHHHHHGDSAAKAIRSFTLCFDQPVSWRGLAVSMGDILQQHSAKLLRVKGVLAVQGSDAPMVVQCVEDVAYPAVQLARWPTNGPLSDRKGRLVFITQGLSPDDELAIKDRLADLPDDNAAVRILAANPTLVTRCWLSQRLPWMGNGSFETVDWVVQPPIRARS